MADLMLVLDKPSAEEAAVDKFCDEAERRGRLGETVVDDFPAPPPGLAFSLWLNSWLIRCLTAFFLDQVRLPSILITDDDLPANQCVVRTAAVKVSVLHRQV